MLKGTKIRNYTKSGGKLSIVSKRSSVRARTVSRLIGSPQKNPKNQYAIYIEQQENLEIDNALFTLQSLEKGSA